MFLLWRVLGGLPGGAWCFVSFRWRVSCLCSVSGNLIAPPFFNFSLSRFGLRFCFPDLVLQLGFGSWVKFFRVGWLVCHLFNRFVIIWKLALVFRAVLCEDCPELDWSLSFRSSSLTARLGTSYPSAVVGWFDSLDKVFPFLD